MKNKNKFKVLDLNIFIIPFIISTVIFIASDIILINSIKTHYYTLLKEESGKYAKSYSYSLTKATEANEIVSDLLDEKLLIASKTTAMSAGHHSNELLAELADMLKVDKIYTYNSQGKIIHSNSGKSIGWKAYPGHPVYDFMVSNKQSIVNDIRQDIETGIYYKYGFFKAADGCFVQLGVLTEKKFFDGFEIQWLLKEMQDDGVADRICFIDNDFNIMGSTDAQLIGSRITNQEAQTSILANNEYGFINNINGEKVYEVFVPVYFQDSKLGTLSIAKSLQDTQNVVTKVSVLGLLTLTIIYISLLYIIISTYRKNKELIQLAYSDAVTGLPNKQYLIDLLTEEINYPENKKALLLINCNYFKIVNLTLGYKYGDFILKKLGEQLQTLADENKKVFRFTDDRFVIYNKNYNSKKDLLSLIDKINEIFNQPFIINGAKQYLTAQIGIVEIQDTCNSVVCLLKNASISLNYIKSNSAVNYVFFNEAMETKLQREEFIERELINAIEEKDATKLYLKYQPQVDLRTKQIIGFEALARMKSDHFGFVSPTEFIDIAERKQLIIPLGNYILNIACDFIKNLNRKGFNDKKVAVNISGIQLLRDDFNDTVMKIIKEKRIEVTNLRLEITESVLLDNFEIINEKLKELQDYKIKIALDDFGTGYSSFYRLQELNIDILKIDKHFINKITVRAPNELITADIISMAHKYGLIVIAEGVELQEQKEYLIENSCDVMQGYLFSKPLLQEDAIKLLQNKKSTIE